MTKTSITKACDKINPPATGEILLDEKDGKERPWQKHKEATHALQEIYNRLGFTSKAGRVAMCGTFLEFLRYVKEATMKLHRANFCKVRLCPMCAWRRSLKIFGQVKQVMDFAMSEQKYRFIFLTLTVENCRGEDLSAEIDQLMQGFKRLSERKQVKKSIKGWFRALEVTHNLDPNSPSYDTYHPHFHVILMVSQTYFKKPGHYISQKKWTSLWRESMRLDYTPIVHVTTVKPSEKKSMNSIVAEVAKYTVKSNEYLLENKELATKTVAILDAALANRRLAAFGGRMKEIHKLLNLDDATEGDLIRTDNEETPGGEDYVVEQYSWHIGYKQYFRVPGKGD